MVKVEIITECLQLGEGPHWDATTQSLYFVDIFGKSIHKYVPSTKVHKKAVIGVNMVSFILPIEGTQDKYLISLGREIAVVTWDGISEKVANIEKLGEVDNAEGFEENRINDGKADPYGRLWAGTMGPEKVIGHFELNKGSLYSYSGGKFTKHVHPVSISNGLAWNVELKKFYYIDSLQRRVFQYDYDIEKGTIENCQTIFTFDKHKIDGFPDGQTIDTDGNLWIAVFNGYRVIKIDPRRPETLLETIDIPAKQVTSVAFGGRNLDELYVTSAGLTVDGVELKPPEHGAVYKVTGTGSKGLPGVPVKI